MHVWNTQNGQEVAAGAVGHHGEIPQRSRQRRGGRIATAGDDHTVRIWDAATGKELRRFEHGNWVRALAFSSDGRLVASSSLDDTVRLWDVDRGKEVFKLPGHGRLGGWRRPRIRAGRPSIPLLRR